jgi:hypothetical protein
MMLALLITLAAQEVSARPAGYVDEEAFVRLRCPGGPKKASEDCEVISEDPPGCGYGKIAVSLLRAARTARPVENSSATEGSVEIPIRFKMLVPQPCFPKTPQ